MPSVAPSTRYHSGEKRRRAEGCGELLARSPDRNVPMDRRGVRAGRRNATGNRVGGLYPPREFESLPLRHPTFARKVGEWFPLIGCGSPAVAPSKRYPSGEERRRASGYGGAAIRIRARRRRIGRERSSLKSKHAIEII